ncbi:hypothetical protein C8F04DRAFT_1261843 [Mycena alexandri]|uniref:DUF1996 domain-containing protein n=1 Tax=Mycena alexandri TaxID=1745969 RepID=A0AAD6SRT1_9AGAR|nr:hypothetical protein C8F04DRAFT_1261843 [Mycena alexandri]
MSQSSTATRTLLFPPPSSFSSMLRPSFVALLGSVGVANAWFRVPCTDPLVSERLDPIISPGGNPSNHVHTINGGSNFNPTYTYDNLRASNCTNCLVAQDLSNYWYPKLYFQDPSTKEFEPVPNGGLLVYYQNRGDGDVGNGGAGLKAFPPGLKMITGDPKRRTKKICYWPGNPGRVARTRDPMGFLGGGTGFPTTDCEAGFNARLHMPACWDGVNLDSADHVSHTAFLSGLDNGSCPPGFVYMMKLFYEVTWTVTDFAGRWNPAKDAWPFAYAHGDPTGFGWHGDFQNGWDTGVLQSAIDKCNNPNDDTGAGITTACSYLTVKTQNLSNQCKIQPVEVINGTLAKLPGCNPLQYGPQDATIYTPATCPQ